FAHASPSATQSRSVPSSKSKFRARPFLSVGSTPSAATAGRHFATDRTNKRRESGRGLRALQDLADDRVFANFAKRPGVRAVLGRFLRRHPTPSHDETNLPGQSGTKFIP